MCFSLRSVLLVLLGLCSTTVIVYGQGKPIGLWRSHLPYNTANGIASDGTTLYALSEQSFFSYNAVNGELSAYSKVDGMADVGMSQIGYDAATNTVILGYQTANIDLFKDNTFYNMPDIKNAPFTGARTINGIYTDKGMAYVSSTIGIVVINLEKRQVKETYVFSKNSQTIAINAFTADATYFYAATPNGLYRAQRNHPNLVAFSAWVPMDTVQSYTGLATVGQKVYATGRDSLYVVNGNSLQYLLNTGKNTVHIDAGKDVLHLSVFYSSKGYGSVKRIDQTNQIVDSFRFGYPRQTAVLADGSLWVADNYEGLNKHTGGDNHQPYIPSGPFSYSTFDILPYNKNVWIAHGGYTDSWFLTFNRAGVSNLNNDKWTSYNPSNTSYMNGMFDVIDVSQDASGNIYAGSIREGMAVIRPDGSGYRIKKDSLEAKEGEPDIYPATSSETDQGGNLWVTQLGSANELAVRTAGGTWYHYTTPYGGDFPHGAAGLIIDDYNQKWYYGPGSNPRSLIVYNDNNTPETGSDDTYRQFRKGAGQGNLPSNRIFCLAKDRDGAIWVGTDDGVAIISCGSVATQGQCDAELRVVQYDQFPDYLFKGEQVKTIAVDGANRKWVGTNNGVWLISPDADKVIYRFTRKTSPLPSDAIQKIAVDPVTGDVYIGTDQGMVSFRSTATDGATTQNTIVTYPNPVPAGYGGTIAIKGLVTDADVRITDIAGQMIYRTKALGGQAVWSGLDYTGHRPQTGVYLIFVTNKDGSQAQVGKMMFNH